MKYENYNFPERKRLQNVEEEEHVDGARCFVIENCSIKAEGCWPSRKSTYATDIFFSLCAPLVEWHNWWLLPHAPTRNCLLVIIRTKLTFVFFTLIIWTFQIKTVIVTNKYIYSFSMCRWLLSQLKTNRKERELQNKVTFVHWKVVLKKSFSMSPWSCRLRCQHRKSLQNLIRWNVQLQCRNPMCQRKSQHCLSFFQHFHRMYV